MTWATASVLVPFLDWRTDPYVDDSEMIRIECQRPRMSLAGNVMPCGWDLDPHPTSAGMLQAIRVHAASLEHEGVTWTLQVHARADRQVPARSDRLMVWADDVRDPSPEEIAIAATTPDGSYWRLDSGAVVAEITGDEPGQRYRIVAEVSA
jgi:hypothetical protein